MDEFIRQAYADGMLNDDSHIAPNPIDHNPSLTSHTTTTNQIPTPFDEPEELIFLSDDDHDHPSSIINNPPPSSTISYLSPPAPPPPPVKPSVPRISLPYTYLSLVRYPTFPSNTTYQDFTIKGCFSSLSGNPRVVKNEYDLKAYLNDGSDCLFIRIASDLLAQHIGMTVKELNEKRVECKNDFDKQNLQTNFNERLKKFGHHMQNLHAMIVIRFFIDDQLPMVISIDEI